MQRCFYFIFCLLALALTGCRTSTTIVNDVPEREANEIVVLLASKGIDAEKMPAPVAATGAAAKAQVYDIAVPSHQVTEALAILNQAGLPRIRGTTLLDIFGTKGLVPSQMQDRIRYQEGLSDQLAATIRKMDGIIDANVQITFPQEEEEEEEALTASVYVKHRGILDNPNSLTITKIKRLVASAIPGLKIDNVSVVTDRALYADITLEPSGLLMEEKAYVSIWGVTVAKESASLFRLIFYIFIVLLFIFLCLLAWMIWKAFPIMSRQGGWLGLFRPHQYAAKLPEGEGESEMVEEET